MFRKKKLNGIVIGTTLVEGLPLAHNSDLVVKLIPENITFITPSTKQEFEIDISKITTVDYKSETEMEKVIHQSAPGMILGAAAFGILGAMIGGRVKTKEKRVVSHFLIINYQSDGQKQIVLQSNDGFGVSQFVDYFKKLKPQIQPKNIQL